MRLLAWTVSTAGLIGLGSCAPTAAPEPRLLADPGGPIELVVTSVNSARRSALPNAELIANIVNALPSDVRILILTNDRDAFTVASDPAPERVDFLELPADNPITIWPQDPFLVLTGPTGPNRLLMSRQFDRAGDSMMASTISDALGWAVSVSTLVFEGGNIVADAEQAFVGENTVRFNSVELGITEVAVVKRLQAELGRPVSVIGPSPQPVPHIDMMLTPLGEGEIVVADSRLGAEIAERALRENPDEVARFERRTASDFFGDPEIRQRVTPDGELIEAPTLEGSTQAAVDGSHRLADYFDALAKTLEERGFQVHRTPLLQTFPSGDDELASERPFREVLDYPVLTYNNVILETRGAQRVVYLPQYGFEAMDRAARELWQSLGYEVTPVAGFTTSALYGGALRCSVKVLARADTR